MNEFYVFNNKNLKSEVISQHISNNVLYKTEKLTGDLFLETTNISQGVISYINKLEQTEQNILCQSNGTIITQEGLIIFSFIYNLETTNTETNNIIQVNLSPSSISGKYIFYNDIQISMELNRTNGNYKLNIQSTN